MLLKRIRRLVFLNGLLGGLFRLLGFLSRLGLRGRLLTGSDVITSSLLRLNGVESWLLTRDGISVLGKHRLGFRSALLRDLGFFDSLR